MKAKKISLTQYLLKDLFDYKEGNLFRKNGVVAGGLHKSGYRQIKINDIQYPAHRLIWIYHYGSINEDLQIDHINGIKNDNRIENLRLVTVQQNCYNRSKLKSKGYSWSINNKKWQASIWLNGKSKYLGSFLNELDARNAYLNECLIHHKI
jgi:hypothetical protein